MSLLTFLVMLRLALRQFAILRFFRSSREVHVLPSRPLNPPPPGAGLNRSRDARIDAAADPYGAFVGDASSWSSLIRKASVSPGAPGDSGHTSRAANLRQ